MAHNSFNANAVLLLGDQPFEIFRLTAILGSKRLTFSYEALMERWI
ncbi:hypothetical protein [Thiocapsa sp. UBA6158]|jgi:hypothetical protein|nr:hypothetical protein [Thiocapsa sp. UBA6158]